MTAAPGARVYFLDTSALIKAYVFENGTDLLDIIFQENATRYVSTMGVIEAVSVLQRLHSVEESLSRPQFEQLCARLLADVALGRVRSVDLTSLSVAVALELETEQYMTAVDAAQVAVAAGLGDGVIFVSSDDKLNRVAREQGLRVLDPTAPASH